MLTAVDTIREMLSFDKSLSQLIDSDKHFLGKLKVLQNSYNF